MGIVSIEKVKITHVIYAENHVGIGGIYNVLYQDGLLMYVGYAEYQWICAWCMILPHGMINQQEPQLNHSEDSIQHY